MFNRDEEYIRKEEEFIDDPEKDGSVLSETAETNVSNTYGYTPSYETDANGVFTEVLEYKEEILWSKKKSGKLSKEEKETMRKTLFMAVIWTSISLFTFMTSFLHVEGSRNNGIGMFVGALFTFIGLWLFKMAIPKKNVWYAVTDKRVIVCNKKGAKYSSYLFSNIVNLRMRREKDGTGTIMFNYARVFSFDNPTVSAKNKKLVINLNGPSDERYSNAEHTTSVTGDDIIISSVDNPEYVYNIIEKRVKEEEIS